MKPSAAASRAADAASVTRRRSSSSTADGGVLTVLRGWVDDAERAGALRDWRRDAGAIPSFKGYSHPPFPASICASVNDEVVHGIPGDRVVDIARDVNRFTYLSACAPEMPIVVGDARLTLADALRGRVPKLYVIGDANQPQTGTNTLTGQAYTCAAADSTAGNVRAPQPDHAFKRQGGRHPRHHGS